MTCTLKSGIIRKYAIEFQKCLPSSISLNVRQNNQEKRIKKSSNLKSPELAPNPRIPNKLGQHRVPCLLPFLEKCALSGQPWPHYLEPSLRKQLLPTQLQPTGGDRRCLPSKPCVKRNGQETYFLRRPHNTWGCLFLNFWWPLAREQSDSCG